MTETFLKSLAEGTKALGVSLDEKKREQLFLYYQMLTEKNKVMNLTAITDETEFVQKHIVDSLAFVHAGSVVVSSFQKGDIDVIDVGTGAGLPGIVLKICYPDIRLVLFDSLLKRLRFLDEVISALKLRHAKTLHGRAEDIGQEANFREAFDIAVSRAVANLSTLSEYCLPLVKTGGLFLPYKAGDIDGELSEAKQAIRTLGGNVLAVKKYQLPNSDIARSILLIKKAGHTPKAYPRKAGIPAKKPIGEKKKLPAGIPLCHEKRGRKEVIPSRYP